MKADQNYSLNFFICWNNTNESSEKRGWVSVKSRKAETILLVIMHTNGSLNCKLYLIPVSLNM
jgi:hypothetical protein